MKKQTESMKSEALSEDERSALIVGLRSEECEKDVSLDEAIEFARKRRKEWVKDKSLGA